MQFIKAGLLASFLALGLTGLNPALAADKAAAATAAAPAGTPEAPASVASIREMMEITHVREMLEDLMGSVRGMFKNEIRQSMAGRQLNARQQEIFADMQTQMMAEFDNEMKWEALEPLFVEIYRKSLSQADVDGAIAFYKTKAGQDILAKMPAIMQNSKEAMREYLDAMEPRMKKIEDDAKARIAAAGNDPQDKAKPRKD